MCKFYITRLKRECKLKGKYDGFCGKHKKSSVDKVTKTIMPKKNTKPKKAKRKLGKAGK